MLPATDPSPVTVMGEKGTHVKPCQMFPLRQRVSLRPEQPSLGPEFRYWRSFKRHEISELISEVTSIDFFPSDSSNEFAATYSTHLTVFNSETFEPKAAFSSANDVAYSASYRSDGRLIAAGRQSGLVQVFTLHKRSVLRRLCGHMRPVRLVKFPHVDKLHLFSGGEDAMVKYWDVTSETQISDLRGHRDYVRCGDGSPVSDDIFVTGSYDHTVRLWDTRAANDGSMLDMKHGKPVEDVLFLPSASMIVTSGGNMVKIWDVIGGGKLVHTIASHTKTVTSMCVGQIGKESGDGSQQFRLLSVGLDGYMKVFDYAKMKVTHSMRFPAQLLSIGLSSDCSVRAIGTLNGIIFCGKRKIAAKKEDPDKDHRPQAISHRYFTRRPREKPSDGDYLVLKPKKVVKLAEHDKYLKKFQHKEALLSALRRRNREDIVAVIEELTVRRKLVNCVTNMNKEELGLLLVFLNRNVTLPRYGRLLMGLATKVVEIRGEDIIASEELKRHLLNMKRSIKEEVEIQARLLCIHGMVSTLVKMAGRR